MTYMGSGDPACQRTDYYPVWLDHLADDVTLEGAAINGTVHGAEDVRAIVVHARTLYEYQDFNYAGTYGENNFLEDYTTQVRGEHLGVVVTVHRNAAGVVQHLVVNHRPRRAVLFFSRLMGEKFGAEHFLVESAISPVASTAPRCR